MNESDLSRELRCEYARNTGIKVDNIPVTSCGTNACIYRHYASFGDMRKSGPNRSFCLAEGNVPRELVGLEKAARGK